MIREAIFPVPLDVRRQYSLQLSQKSPKAITYSKHTSENPSMCKISSLLSDEENKN